jgi:hypothetical protein
MMASYVPAHTEDYSDKPTRKHKTSLPYLKNINGVSFVIGKINQDKCQPRADGRPEDYEKAHIHYLLRTESLGSTNSDHDQKANGKTHGNEKAVSMNGQRTY